MLICAERLISRDKYTFKTNWKKSHESHIHIIYHILHELHLTNWLIDSLYTFHIDLLTSYTSWLIDWLIKCTHFFCTRHNYMNPNTYERLNDWLIDWLIDLTKWETFENYPKIPQLFQFALTSFTTLNSEIRFSIKKIMCKKWP